MLTAEQAVLWQKILDFQIDDPDAVFKFSERLARENGWSKRYTNRVITEYKRFIFLCCIAENGVTPSDAVDQAWHLHLTFTKSYWGDLCRETLGKEIHHNPTKGGNNEALKYDGFYTGTHKLYEKSFAASPPADIWPANQPRFSEINFQRVNMHRYWLVRKPGISKTIGMASTVVITGLIFIQASDNEIFALIFLGFFILIAAFSYKKEGGNRDDKSDGSCNSAACGADGNFHSGASW